jgi:hypothetical protein
MLNRPVKAALVAAMFFAQWASAGELTLYSHPDFRGRPVTVAGNEANLNDRGFNDRASSMIVRSGRWELCEHVNFGGRCVVVGPGEYRNMDQFSDRVSSVREVADRGREDQGRRDYAREDQGRRDYGRREQGAPVELFSGPRFQGQNLPLGRDSKDLNEFAFNDRAGSVVVYEGTWTFCQDVRYKGRCMTLEPGRYEHMRGMDNQVSSVKRVR